ncbi:DUF1456 family protein [Psychroflexus tropicus]|uniref:DUF1456 family protein n=1 Tax=Psychroflexus tropicus TaxID=197345 RepID=UPI000366E3DA|nr:DUF1456 family protein [Psychroflexus tropicus]
MTNNDVLRRLRYTFGYTDSKMISFFKLADVDVSRAEVSDWLKPDEDEAFVELEDKMLAVFLNGLIIDKRGKREEPQPETETYINNNDVLKKLKIAFELKSEDIIELYQLAGKKVSKHELSSFLRRPTQPQYRELMDQYLRNFLYGLQLKYKKK